MIAQLTALLTPLDTTPGLDKFGNDNVWLVILKAVLIFLILVLLTLFNIWFERRVVARMQHRIGPNVNGPFGLLQSLADGVKLALKEDIIPKAADKVVFLLAPVIVVATLNVGNVISGEATLDFLGVGLQYPEVSWGLQLNLAQTYFVEHPHLLIFPAAFLSATVLSFLMLGDAVRDALDPKLR